jgi:hypothetical protein
MKKRKKRKGEGRREGEDKKGTNRVWKRNER